MALKPEQLEMIKIFDWIRIHHLEHITFHIANERKASPQAGFLLKRMGVLAGVSDIFMATQRDGFSGLFIEVKAIGKNGKYGLPSENQKRFMMNMRNEGYMAVLANGGDAAIEIIKNYLS